MTTTTEPTPNPTGGGIQPSNGAAGTQPTPTTPGNASVDLSSVPEHVRNEIGKQARLDAEQKLAKERAAYQKQIDDLKAAQMSEDEKKIAEARKQGETEAAKAWGSKLLAAELRARGYAPEWASFLTVENPEDSASIDQAIKSASEKYAWFRVAETPPPGAIQPGGPAVKPPPPKQWSRSKIAALSMDEWAKHKDEILAAQKAGTVSPD